MPIFFYEATNEEGELQSGEVNASSEEEVVSVLARKKLVAVQIEQHLAATNQVSRLNWSFERFSTLDRIILVRNLATTIKAGLSMLEALEILIGDATKQIIKTILVAAKINVQNGQPLSKTFTYYKKYFPPIFIGMVKAGEESGKLDESLEELSQHMTKEYNLIKKVKSALAYPIILLVASVGIVSLLLTFILPRLTKTLMQSKVELPTITKALIWLSDLLSANLFVDGLVIIFIVWFFTYFRKTKRGGRFFFHALFSLPVTRNLVQKIILVRFARTLGSLLASALPVNESLLLTSEAVGNDVYREAIVMVDQEVMNGSSIAEALDKHRALFPRMLTSLVSVGERTGSLEHVLKTFADFYENDVDNSLKDLVTFLEPILLLFMGGLVALIAISILLPIYQLVGNFV